VAQTSQQQQPQEAEEWVLAITLVFAEDLEELVSLGSEGQVASASVRSAGAVGFC